MDETNCSCATDTKDTCACGSTPVLVFPCSGGSNVGQISNSAAVEMDRQGKARIYCLAGVSAHIGGMVDSARAASVIIAIDGCAVACARQALEHAGVKVDKSILITGLGIEKNHIFEWSDSQVKLVIEACMIG